jgi:cytochrome c oxidase cbb3-type subunit III
VIARGVPSTSMPAFGQQYGGSLTDSQIKLIVDQMKSRWGGAEEFKGVQLPSYSIEYGSASTAGSASQAPGNPGQGDSARGAQVYAQYCAQCHGPNGTGGPKAGSIVDPSFLKLVSDQSLRTTVIVGRSDIGKPDWRSDLPGHPMTPGEISDVVAWLSAQRPTALMVATPIPTVAGSPQTTPSPTATSAPDATSSRGKAAPR